MDVEMDALQRGDQKQRPKLLKFCFSSKALLVLFYCILQTTGQVGGPLLTRMYFLHGGKRKWISAWLLTAGFPCLIIPMCISYMRNRSKSPSSRHLVTPRFVGATAIIGSLLGIDSYMYTIGVAYLPVSVSSLLGSSQLAFTSIFAFLVVKHKVTHYSINAVVLMTFGTIVLGLNMNGDRPAGESNGLYTLGFFMTIGAAALHGFLLPAVEYTHMKARVPVTYDLVMQFQFLVSAFATLFCTIPMIINKDFQAMPKEAAEFELGPLKYYVILFSAALALQCLCIGCFGIVFTSSAFLGGIVSSLLVPVQQLFAVFFLPESFNAEKGMALAMCLWGFASYFYGEYKTKQKQPDSKQKPELEAKSQDDV